MSTVQSDSVTVAYPDDDEDDLNRWYVTTDSSHAMLTSRCLVFGGCGISDVAD